MTDVFGDVLRLIRLRSCVYFVREFWSPWAISFGGGKVAQFHVVLRGHCLLEAAGQTFHGAPGDVFLFPRGEAHRLADSAGRDPVSSQDYKASLHTDAPLFGHGDTPTQLICGHYEYRNDIDHPLIAELAPVVHVGSLEHYPPDTLHSVIPTLMRELDNDGPGASVVVEKLAEVMLVQVIRAYFAKQPRSTGVLAGLFDARLVKALRLMHAAFDQRLTLEALAVAAGMSRSAFAAHFKSVVGMAPMAYLAQWRMYRAHQFLQMDSMTVAQAAAKVGYDSDIAFSRAFKRQFGTTAAAFRRRVNAGAKDAV